MRPSTKIRFMLAGTFAFVTVLQAQSAPPPQQQAQVRYAEGKLTVIASNSSLNQILRDIARETGMKITGGVTDERVFGQYGPAAPAKILGQLLDGTGSNMLLMHATAATPAELILTPRQGGPTPPNPNAYHDEEPPPVERPQYPVEPQPEANKREGAPNTEPAQSPNEVKTPQQIYEQLQQMRQQQQQQQQQSNPQ